MPAASPEEIVRSGIASVNRCLQSGDLSHWIDGYIHHDFVWDTLETGRVSGQEGARQVVSEWLSAFDALRVTINDVTALDADRVLVAQSITGQLKGTDAAQGLAYDLGVIYMTRDGKVVACHEYPTREEAATAAGLSS